MLVQTAKHLDTAPIHQIEQGIRKYPHWHPPHLAPDACEGERLIADNLEHLGNAVQKHSP